MVNVASFLFLSVFKNKACSKKTEMSLKSYSNAAQKILKGQLQFEKKETQISPF